jgi:hypothetical protein
MYGLLHFFSIAHVFNPSGGRSYMFSKNNGQSEKNRKKKPHTAIKRSSASNYLSNIENRDKILTATANQAAEMISGSSFTFHRDENALLTKGAAAASLNSDSGPLKSEGLAKK